MSHGGVPLAGGVPVTTPESLKDAAEILIAVPESLNPTRRIHEAAQKLLNIVNVILRGRLHSAKEILGAVEERTGILVAIREMLRGLHASHCMMEDRCDTGMFGSA